MNNPWEYINNNKEWAGNATFTKITSDIYHVLFVIGIGLIAISLVLLFLRWALYRQQGGAINRRNTIVGPLLFKLILVAIICCLPYLVGEVFRIFNLIAKSLVA